MYHVAQHATYPKKCNLCIGLTSSPRSAVNAITLSPMYWCFFTWEAECRGTDGWHRFLLIYIIRSIVEYQDVRKCLTVVCVQSILSIKILSIQKRHCSTKACDSWYDWTWMTVHLACRNCSKPLKSGTHMLAIGRHLFWQIISMVFICDLQNNQKYQVMAKHSQVAKRSCHSDVVLDFLSPLSYQIYQVTARNLNSLNANLPYISWLSLEVNKKKKIQQHFILYSRDKADPRHWDWHLDFPCSFQIPHYEVQLPGETACSDATKTLYKGQRHTKQDLRR